MSLRGRLPWIVAGAAVALALLTWEGYRLERDKSAGVPEAVEKLADRIEGEAVKREELERRLKRQEHVMLLLLSAPEGPVEQHPALFERIKALGVDDSECIKALTGAVVGARLRGEITAKDRSGFIDLALECLK